jgi:hypothetical protein
MQLSAHRSLSLTYAGLALLPLGLLVVLLQYTSWPRLAATSANPYVLSALGIGSIALSALNYPERTRPRYFWLIMLLASLAMAAGWAFALANVLPALPMLMCCIPAWQSWRLYRRGDPPRLA